MRTDLDHHAFASIAPVQPLPRAVQVRAVRQVENHTDHGAFAELCDMLDLTSVVERRFGD